MAIRFQKNKIEIEPAKFNEDKVAKQINWIFSSVPITDFL